MARTRGHKSHEMKAEAVATKQRLVGKAFHQGLRGHSLASSGHDSAVLFPDAPAGGASCPQQSWSLGAVGRVPGLLGGPSSLTELSGGMTDVPAAAGSPG